MKQVANVAIYYQQLKEEDLAQAVDNVIRLIQQLETLHVIKGVFLDNFNESTELMDLLNSPLSEIDIIYINKPIINEFDNALISQLSRTEKFQIMVL